MEIAAGLPILTGDGNIWDKSVTCLRGEEEYWARGICMPCLPYIYPTGEPDLRDSVARQPHFLRTSAGHFRRCTIDVWRTDWSTVTCRNCHGSPAGVFTGRSGDLQGWSGMEARREVGLRRQRRCPPSRKASIGHIEHVPFPESGDEMPELSPPSVGSGSGHPRWRYL